MYPVKKYFTELQRKHLNNSPFFACGRAGPFCPERVQVMLLGLGTVWSTRLHLPHPIANEGAFRPFVVSYHEA